MTDWAGLLAQFLDGRLTERQFHDRFLDLWRQDRDTGLPPAIERLFYTVEAFTPDPALRDPRQPWEADGAALRAGASRALADLQRKDLG